MTGEPLIAIRGADLGYGRLRILHVPRLCIRPGERWFILGRNGSGKTTLLHTIVGLIRPLSGSVDRAPTCKGLDSIAFVPQVDETHPVLPMTLSEYVGLGLVGIPIKSVQRRCRIDNALARTGLRDLASASLWTLSGGMRQRALLARALARNPRLLVMDEPTNGLDPFAEASLMELIQAACRDLGMAAIISTHDVLLASRNADYWALIIGGTLRVGHPQDTGAAFLMKDAFGVNPLGIGDP